MPASSRALARCELREPAGASVAISIAAAAAASSVSRTEGGSFVLWDPGEEGAFEEREDTEDGSSTHMAGGEGGGGGSGDGQQL